MFAAVKNNEFINYIPGAFVVTETAAFMPDYEIRRYKHDGSAKDRARAYGEARLDANRRSEDSITGGYGYSYNVTEESTTH